MWGVRDAFCRCQLRRVKSDVNLVASVLLCSLATFEELARDLQVWPLNLGPSWGLQNVVDASAWRMVPFARYDGAL